MNYAYKIGKEAGNEVPELHAWGLLYKAYIFFQIKTNNVKSLVWNLWLYGVSCNFTNPLWLIKS